MTAITLKILIVKNIFSRTARDMEEIVKSNGVVPATVGVLDGKIYVGQQAKISRLPIKF